MSTKEILQLKEQIGIDSALKIVGNEIPFYRIDSVVALNFAFDYDKIKDEKVQTNFLSEVSLFFRNDSLNAKLIQRIAGYRTEFLEDFNSIPLIDDDLFYAIYFQRNKHSIEPLKADFNFWTSIMDSARINLNSQNMPDSSIIRISKYSEYNAFMFGWTLYKLNDNEFTAERVNAISPSNKHLKVQKTGPKIRRTGRTDTITLSKKYNSLAELDFASDSSLIKIFGFLPASLKYSITLIYNSNAGILNYEGWFIWKDRRGNSYRKPYEGRTYKIILTAPDKVVITWLSRYFS